MILADTEATSAVAFVLLSTALKDQGTISSVDKPVDESFVVDRYGRPWLVRSIDSNAKKSGEVWGLDRRDCWLGRHLHRRLCDVRSFNRRLTSLLKIAGQCSSLLRGRLGCIGAGMVGGEAIFDFGIGIEEAAEVAWSIRRRI